MMQNEIQLDTDNYISISFVFTLFLLNCVGSAC